MPFLDLSINSLVASNAFQSGRGQLLKEHREEGRKHDFSHGLIIQCFVKRS
ncbi:hypothetical protein HanPSC8_Chr13g0586401 [Helianthus annuus]|nr:hypothetical protein HanPSC8_Chr13g0586401 [Helianthus annuus]